MSTWLSRSFSYTAEGVKVYKHARFGPVMLVLSWILFPTVPRASRVMKKRLWFPPLSLFSIWTRSLIQIGQHHKTFPSSFPSDSPYLDGETHCTVKNTLHCRPFTASGESLAVFDGTKSSNPDKAAPLNGIRSLIVYFPYAKTNLTPSDHLIDLDFPVNTY